MVCDSICTYMHRCICLYVYVYMSMFVLGNSCMIFGARAAQKSAASRSGELTKLVSDL